MTVGLTVRGRFTRATLRRSAGTAPWKMKDPESRISLLLNDPAGSSDELLGLVYDQLRRLASAKLARERPGHTLQPTALVHEAFLRIVGDREGGSWEGRRQFFCAAAEAMRRILIERARRRARLRHGGEAERIEMDEVDLGIVAPSDDLLDVEAALGELEASDPRARELVNLRYFAGLTVEETAAALGVSVSSVEREWRFVRSWLRSKLDQRDAR